MLANERQVAAAMHNLTLSALLFPLPRSVEHRTAIARWRATPAHAQAHSLGFDSGRGGGSARYGLAGPPAVRHQPAADGKHELAGQEHGF